MEEPRKHPNVHNPEIWTGPMRHGQPVPGTSISTSDQAYAAAADLTKKIFDVSETGALKDTAGKPRIDLVPFELIEGAGRAFEFGAHKYAEHNWRKGMKLSKIVRSLLSHICKWWMMGEDIDKESGLHHLDHAAACLGMIMATLAEQPQLNDRYKRS